MTKFVTGFLFVFLAFSSVSKAEEMIGWDFDLLDAQGIYADLDVDHGKSSTTPAATPKKVDSKSAPARRHGPMGNNASGKRGAAFKNIMKACFTKMGLSANQSMELMMGMKKMRDDMELAKTALQDARHAYRKALLDKGTDAKTADALAAKLSDSMADFVEARLKAMNHIAFKVLNADQREKGLECLKEARAKAKAAHTQRQAKTEATRKKWSDPEFRKEIREKHRARLEKACKTVTPKDTRLAKVCERLASAQKNTKTGANHGKGHGANGHHGKGHHGKGHHGKGHHGKGHHGKGHHGKGHHGKGRQKGNTSSNQPKTTSMKTSEIKCVIEKQNGKELEVCKQYECIIKNRDAKQTTSVCQITRMPKDDMIKSGKEKLPEDTAKTDKKDVSPSTSKKDADTKAEAAKKDAAA